MDSVIIKKGIIRQKYINEIMKQGILEGERKMLKQIFEIQCGELTIDHLKQIEKANSDILKEMAMSCLNVDGKSCI